MREQSSTHVFGKTFQATAALASPSLVFNVVEKTTGDEGDSGVVAQRTLALAPIRSGAYAGFYCGHIDSEPHPFLIDVETHDKLAAANQLMPSLGLGWDTLAAMGDDWPDLPLMTRAAFACAPANAHAEVKAVAHHVTAAHGGHGATRECCDLLLMAAGRYAALLNGHLQTLDGST